MEKKPHRGIEWVIGVSSLVHEILIKNLYRGSNYGLKKTNLPVPKDIENYYYYHTGDYMDGFVGSLLTNYFLTYGLGKLNNFTTNHLNQESKLKKLVERINNPHFINIVSGTISIGVVTLEETVGYLGTPELEDIPAGVAGSLTHMAIRYYSIKRSEEDREDRIEGAVKRFLYS